jgi:Uma2 family endonuclease
MAAVITQSMHRMVLQGVSWQTYQSLILDLESESGKRLTYDQGTLEIMAPLPPHEQFKRRLGRIVETATEETGVEIASFGSTTWSRQDLNQGLEPDECYYIQNEQTIRGKSAIDLTQDPPPDLAIEIDYTHSSLNRMKIYKALGVPEVWRYDGSTFRMYRLIEGHYQLISRSLVLPILERENIQQFLDISSTMGENAWICSFRQGLREKISSA